MVKHILATMLTVIGLLCFLSCSDEPNNPPTTSITATPESGEVPLVVQFYSNATDPDGDSLTYQWDFGDESSGSTEKNPIHTFTDAGVFTVSCNVTDNRDSPLSSSDTIEITAQNKVPEITRIKPAWKVTHMPTFTLTITGKNFTPSSRVMFKNQQKETTFISETGISCQIEPNDTLIDNAAGTENDAFLPVWVRNPSPGGGDSVSIDFQVKPFHTFSEPVEISPTATDFSNHRHINTIRFYETDVLYLFWLPQDKYSYKFKVSRDKGKTWEYEHPDMNISLRPFSIDNDGIIYRVHAAHITDNYTISFQKGNLKNGTWEDESIIFPGLPLPDGYVYSMQDLRFIRLSTGTLFTVWMQNVFNVDYSTGTPNSRDRHVDFERNLYIYSLDDGLTWSEVDSLPPDFAKEYFPVLGGDRSDTIHYYYYLGVGPWAANNCCYMYSYDAQTWSTPISISSLTGYRDHPFIGQNGKHYQLNEEKIGNKFHFYFKYSDSPGETWSEARKIVTKYYEHSVEVVLAVDSVGNIDAFYTSGLAKSNYAIYCKRSIDNGITWTSPQRVSPNNSNGLSVHVDSEGELYILYQSAFSPYPVYFTRSERDE